MAQKSKKTDTVATLSKEVEALRGDLASLVDTLKEAGVTESHSAMARAETAGDALKETLTTTGHDVAEAAQDAAASAQSFLKDKPVAAVLAAAAAGLAVGLATSKRS